MRIKVELILEVDPATWEASSVGVLQGIPADVAEYFVELAEISKPGQRGLWTLLSAKGRQVRGPRTRKAGL